MSNWGIVTPEIKILSMMRGKPYKPKLLPEDITRGPIGKCFDWCALEASKSHKFNDGKYRYVEGLASDPDDPKQWIYHAWLTDGIHAFDPTWSANVAGREVLLPVEYIGVEMDILKVAKFMTTTEYQGVMGNRWRDPRLADRAIYSIIGD